MTFHGTFLMPPERRLGRGEKGYCPSSMEIEMNLAFWLPVLFALGIVALAGFVVFLAGLDSYGPSLLHWLAAKGQTHGGSHAYTLAHGHTH
jgi:hypothetical protein